MSLAIEVAVLPAFGRIACPARLSFAGVRRVIRSELAFSYFVRAGAAATEACRYDASTARAAIKGHVASDNQPFPHAKNLQCQISQALNSHCGGWRPHPAR